VPTKKELDDIAEEQRRQRTSVVELAREDGMVGNRPGGVTDGKVVDEPTEEPKKEDK
jgi:hypothetical protein